MPTGISIVSHMWFDACCVDIVFIMLVRSRMTSEAKTAESVLRFDYAVEY